MGFNASHTEESSSQFGQVDNHKKFSSLTLEKHSFSEETSVNSQSHLEGSSPLLPSSVPFLSIREFNVNPSEPNIHHSLSEKEFDNESSQLSSRLDSLPLWKHLQHMLNSIEPRLKVSPFNPFPFVAQMLDIQMMERHASATDDKAIMSIARIVALREEVEQVLRRYIDIHEDTLKQSFAHCARIGDAVQQGGRKLMAIHRGIGDAIDGMDRCRTYLLIFRRRAFQTIRMKRVLHQIEEISRQYNMVRKLLSKFKRFPDAIALARLILETIDRDPLLPNLACVMRLHSSLKHILSVEMMDSCLQVIISILLSEDWLGRNKEITTNDVLHNPPWKMLYDAVMGLAQLGQLDMTCSEIPHRLADSLDQVWWRKIHSVIQLFPNPCHTSDGILWPIRDIHEWESVIHLSRPWVEKIWTYANGVLRRVYERIIVLMRVVTVISQHEWQKNIPPIQLLRFPNELIEWPVEKLLWVTICGKPWDKTETNGNDEEIALGDNVPSNSKEESTNHTRKLCGKESWLLLLRRTAASTHVAQKDSHAEIWKFLLDNMTSPHETKVLNEHSDTASNKENSNIHQIEAQVSFSTPIPSYPTLSFLLDTTYKLVKNGIQKGDIRFASTKEDIESSSEKIANSIRFSIRQQICYEIEKMWQNSEKQKWNWGVLLTKMQCGYLQLSQAFCIPLSMPLFVKSNEIAKLSNMEYASNGEGKGKPLTSLLENPTKSSHEVAHENSSVLQLPSLWNMMRQVITAPKITRNTNEISRADERMSRKQDKDSVGLPSAEKRTELFPEYIRWHITSPQEWKDDLENHPSLINSDNNDNTADATNISSRQFTSFSSSQRRNEKISDTVTSLESGVIDQLRHTYLTPHPIHAIGCLFSLESFGDWWGEMERRLLVSPPAVINRARIELTWLNELVICYLIPHLRHLIIRPLIQEISIIPSDLLVFISVYNQDIQIRKVHDKTHDGNEDEVMIPAVIARGYQSLLDITRSSHMFPSDTASWIIQVLGSEVLQLISEALHPLLRDRSEGMAGDALLEWYFHSIDESQPLLKKWEAWVLNELDRESRIFSETETDLDALSSIFWYFIQMRLSPSNSSGQSTHKENEPLWIELTRLPYDLESSIGAKFDLIGTPHLPTKHLIHSDTNICAGILFGLVWLIHQWKEHIVLIPNSSVKCTCKKDVIFENLRGLLSSPFPSVNSTLGSSTEKGNIKKTTRSLASLAKYGLISLGLLIRTMIFRFLVAWFHSNNVNFSKEQSYEGLNDIPIESESMISHPLWKLTYELLELRSCLYDYFPDTVHRLFFGNIGYLMNAFIHHLWLRKDNIQLKCMSPSLRSDLREVSNFLQMLYMNDMSVENRNSIILLQHTEQLIFYIQYPQDKDLHAFTWMDILVLSGDIMSLSLKEAEWIAECRWKYHGLAEASDLRKTNITLEEFKGKVEEYISNWRLEYFKSEVDAHSYPESLRNSSVSQESSYSYSYYSEYSESDEY